MDHMSMEKRSSTALRNANRKRFSDEQIKFLEFMFEAESRPESQIKQKLANELGLQPKQVSIWFQNRRARLRGKQVEKEYDELKASYDALSSSLESLKRENQSLLNQVQKLKKVQAKQNQTKNYGSEQARNCEEQRIESRGIDSDSKEKTNQKIAAYRHEEATVSRNQERRNTESSREEEEKSKISNQMTESTDGSMSSSDWDQLEYNCFLDEPTCSLQWWEFLS